jgi:hypothetical protein
LRAHSKRSPASAAAAIRFSGTSVPECGSSIAEESGTRPENIILNASGRLIIRLWQSLGGRFFVTTLCRGSQYTAKSRASENGVVEIRDTQCAAVLPVATTRSLISVLGA